jgi:hypothetical protein
LRADSKSFFRSSNSFFKLAVVVVSFALTAVIASELVLIWAPTLSMAVRRSVNVT